MNSGTEQLPLLKYQYLSLKFMLAVTSLLHRILCLYVNNVFS